MTFYHGTASTFEKSILKHGLRKGCGEIWDKLAKLAIGNQHLFPSGVWVSNSLSHAAEYAYMAVRVLRAKKGEQIRTLQCDWMHERHEFLNVPRVFKVSRVRDPNAKPIIFAVEMDDDDVVPLAEIPNEFRAGAIPPEVLTLYSLREEMEIISLCPKRGGA